MLRPAAETRLANRPLPPASSGGRPARRRRKGVVAVEFAVAAPVFILFVFACIEFGRMNMLYHAADDAAYEAARHAVVPGATSTEASDRASDVLDIFGVQGATITITPASLGLADDQLTVDVDIPLDQNGWIFPRFSAGRQVHGSSTLRTERGKFIP